MMWPKEYRDYPIDKLLKKNQVESGKGIVGCEMHDLNGWGNSYQVPRRAKRKSLIGSFLKLAHNYFKK